MSPTIRVCLADRHRLLHVGIETIIKQTEYLTFSGSTTTEEGTLHFCRIYHPHLLLLALNILSQPATAFVTTLRQECPAIKLLILLSDTHETNIHTLLGSGANGFILKSESPDRLVEAIHSVIQGEDWVSPSLLKILLATQNLNLVLSTLTDREKQLLSLLVAGRTDRQIGEELHLSERTVRRILSRLYQRLGAKNRAEATFIAGQNQIPDPASPSL